MVLSLNQYKYVIFANNDILIPIGSIENLYYALKKNVLVLPVTTYKGSGHNPIQALSKQNTLISEEYISNPLNVQSIQNILLNHYPPIQQLKLIPSIVERSFVKLPKFNGFCFAMNISGIKHNKLEYDANNNILFRPDNIMVNFIYNK